MQKAVRVNEGQLLYLALKARQQHTTSGYLYKKSADTGKWQLRWFVLYQNMLFYYESDSAVRPSGVCLLEGCYCERVVLPATLKVIKGESDKQYCFAIYYRSEGQRQYDLRADTESECNLWIDAIQQASFSKVLEQKEQLEQKHLHLLQILDSERQAKWHYVQQTEELTEEVKKLKCELREYKKERKISNDKIEEESEELRKIKKVQSFFRGWLCRRRWKQIVDEYIRSDHAESMRKRNSIVFGMVECEEEYVKQLSTLVSVFLRPLRMAASSKKPPISHEDVNSIFLNSETLLFLHQIFLKGLMARMENWPTLVLDLFDMLLPMLGIYQEYVRNHHYSLQVLAEYKQKPDFNQLLRRYEEKPICEGRSLESFLTFPMHQIPRYIITIHELLAHTPHDHVERKSLEFAQSKLEELSQIMQDEVSETENIRKNLAIERMIVEGCDILLDVNQTFVRQGSLLQILQDKGKSSRGRLGSFSTTFKESKKELVRQVFLFTNHMLLTTRASNGRLHLAKHCGKIPLIDCTLVEDPSSDVYHFDDDSSLDGSLTSSSGNLLSAALATDTRASVDFNGLEFRLIVDWKSGPPISVLLVASTLQEKAAWCSDISQCIENLHYSGLLNTSMTDISSVTMPQSVRSDPKLFRDDVDIKFSRTLNSCKVPQIRHASTDRLLDRLTDLRFLSIDFLNTFLLTYRVFTNSHAVLEALKRVYKNPECGNLESNPGSLQPPTQEPLHRHSFDTSVLSSATGSPPRQMMEFSNSPPSDGKFLVKPQAEKMRRISTGCMKIEVGGEKNKIDSSHSSFSRYDPGSSPKTGTGTGLPQPPNLLIPPKPKLAPIASCETLSDVCDPYTDDTDQSDSGESPEDTYTSAITITTNTPIRLSRSHGCSPRNSVVTFGPMPGESSTDMHLTLDDDDDDSPTGHYEATLTVPNIGNGGGSSETLIGSSNGGYLTLSTSTSSDTLVPHSPRTSPIPLATQLSTPSKTPTSPSLKFGFRSKKISAPPIKIPTSNQLDALALSPASSPKFRGSISNLLGGSGGSGSCGSPVIRRATSPICMITQPGSNTASPVLVAGATCGSPQLSPKLKRAPSPISYSFSSPNIITNINKTRSGKRGSTLSDISDTLSLSSTPRSSFASADGSPPAAKAGTVVTSSRASKRRSSSTAAAAAFAAATAGSLSKDQQGKPISRFHSAGPGDQLKPCHVNKKRESVISTAATMRVLNILRHWVSKHTQDFDCDPQLKAAVKDLLEEMVCNTQLLPAEHKAAASILRVLTKDDQDPAGNNKISLQTLLTPPNAPSKDSFDTLSALDIAEQLTFLDHKIFMAIRSEELLCQAWMKPDKAGKAPHVLLVSKRFNEVSKLVVSEIVSRQNLQDRVACIEKWAAIADICRCMHNYNGVLQICAAFVNSSVYRLKKTWEKIAKQTKQMIDKLQTLVSSESRFKNMRDALHRCDPPCIPYLGMYLTDLSFIEEGTPNVTDEHLVNFSKMRMIAHVIREIQHFQQTSYRIEHHKRITNYLLDPSRLLSDEETYKLSLEIEPRTARVSMSGPAH